MLRHILFGALLTSLLILSFGCSSEPEVAKRRYLQSGQQYMEKGKYQEAQIQFRNALRQDPKFAEAYYQLALANMKMSRWEEAFPALEHAVDLEPNKSEARLSLGQLYVATRKFNKAQEQADAVLASNSRNPEAHQLLGAALWGQEQYQRAREAFLTVTQLRPNDPQAYVNLASADVALNHYPEAEHNFRRAITSDPKFATAYVRLADLYLLEKKAKEAEDVLRRGLQQSPESETFYLPLAAILYSQARNNETAELLQRLAAMPTASADTITAIGDFYAARNESSQALVYYQTGSSKFAGNIALKNRLTALYLNTRKFDEAKQLNDQVLKQYPKDSTARVQHAQILIVRNNLDQAIAELQQQVADTPDSAQAHFVLGTAYWQKGLLARAADEFQITLKAAPDDLGARRSLASLHLSQGNGELATEYAKKVVEMSPSLAESRLLLGNALLLTRNFAGAQQEFRMAQTLEPSNPVPHLRQASVLRAQKKYTAAQKEFETALTMSPHNNDAVALYLDFIAETDLAKALLRARQYAATYPQDASAQYLLGTLLQRSKHFDEAKSVAERCIQLDQNFVPGYFMLGSIFEERNQIDEAIQQYGRALERQATPPLQTLLGNLHLKKGEVLQARHCYERALQMDPDFAIAAANLAWVYTIQNSNLEEALSLAQKAKRMLPDVNSVTDTLGWVHYKRGSYSFAIPLLQQCVLRAPDDATFHYHLGMALAATGETPRAKAELHAALKFRLPDPEAGEARQKLQQLQ